MQRWRTESGDKMQSMCAPGRKWRSFLLLAGLGLVVFLFGQEQSAQAIGFSATGSMGTARQFHAATLLNYSGVLVTGGYSGSSALNSAELYNPATGSFVATTGTMAGARWNHTATRLANGRVLIAGGENGSSILNSAEIYNPATRTFSTPIGNMGSGRRLHTATLLNNGTVLIAGGRSASSSSTTLNSAKIYDPATGLFADTTGNMNAARAYHTATLLADGRVLITGGITSGLVFLNSAEIYDPATGLFTPTTGAMTTARGYHAAVLLSDGSGTVLITGGAASSSITNPSLNTAEIFNPASGGFAATTGAMNNGHSQHTATLLSSGHVLVAGDHSPSGTIGNTAEIFLPDGQAFLSEGTMGTERANYPAVLLDNGTVLLAGGLTNSGATAAAELYSPFAIGVAPASYRFPDTTVSSTSPSQTFTISNSDVSDVSVSAIALSGADAAMYALSPGTCGTLPHTLQAGGGSCTVSVTFSPASTGIKSASLDISSDDPEVPVLSVPLSGTGVIASSTVTVTFAGTGSGSVHSSSTPTPPAELSCSGGSGTPCSGPFPNGTSVTLTPTGNSTTSLFGGWSGACTGTGDCVINNLSANTAVTATFNYIKPAKIVRTQLTYDTLQGVLGAYTAALDGDVIQTRAFPFNESPNFASGKSITINGGYDLNYASNAGFYSVVTGGTFTIGTGQITLSNIIVQ